MIKLDVVDSKTRVCVDTNCEAILSDNNFIKNKRSKIEMHIMISFLRIRKIDATRHETNEYVKVLNYFSEIKNEKHVLTQVIKEIYLTNGFKTNLLIENDFFELENFTINVNNRKTTIANCDVIITLSIKQRNFYVR